jgi:hypothetical protein
MLVVNNTEPVKVSVGFERLFDYQILYLSTDEAS